MKRTLKIAATCLILVASVTGCQKGNLVSNPNAGNADATVPVTLILNHITANFIRQEEQPFGNDASNNNNSYKADQYMISNYAKYWGSNDYAWSYTASAYDILKYTIQLEIQAKAQLGATNNKYLAIAKFFRAYAFIWLSQRVGDIPMSQTGDPITYPTPAYDSQHDVYKNSLQLLDDANAMFNSILSSSTQNTVFNATGDVFGLTNLQWQKLINTYRLRVLISMSKAYARGATSDFGTLGDVKAQFNNIIANPATYPIMGSNNDNMVYKFNATNLYPNWASGSNAYNNFLFVGQPVLNITTSTADPRTYIYATPINLPTPVTTAALSNFSNYQGAPMGTAVASLLGATYSNFNGFRYFGEKTGANAEKFIFIGYPEMCFNIAEAINLGWVSGKTPTDAQAWYNNGIAASFGNLGLTLNVSAPVDQTITVYNVAGGSIGTVTTNYANFLSNVAYNTGNSATALTQILTQKYVALFMNSGWEAYYNYRRTNVPAFPTGAANAPGYLTSGGTIPRRFLYPVDETTANTVNYNAALSSQFGGTDDVTKDTWLTK